MAERPTPTIPILDAGPLLEGGSAGMAQTARAIDAACETIGFFYLVNHGIAHATVAGAFAAAERFFSLPLDQRLAIMVNEFERGYRPLQAVQQSGQIADLKESFDLGIDLPPDHPAIRAGKPLHGSNRWPALARFRAPVEAYFSGVCDLAYRLLEPLAVALGLPNGFFQDLTKPNPLASMRLLRYPAMPADAPPGQWGAAAHTDYGVMTILAQDATGGLELKPRDSDWLPAPCLPDAFLVNVGDLMAVWTNDRYKSMPHRVVNRSPTPRFSIPVFYHPNFDVVVECLPSCRSATSPPKYPPIKVGDYLIAKYNATFAHRKKTSA